MPSRLAKSLVMGLMLGVGAGHAAAQITAKPFPEFRTSDKVNVDVSTGMPFWTVADVGIGPEGDGLRHSVSSYKSSFLNPQDSYWEGVMANPPSQCSLVGVGSPYLVTLNQRGECFYLQNGVFSSYENRGSALQSAPGGYLFTSSDGTRFEVSNTITLNGRYAVTSIKRPSGQITTIYYEGGGPAYAPYRVRSVAKNNGFRLLYRYASNDPANAAAWWPIIGITGYNAAYQACDPNQSCAPAGNWPASSYTQFNDGNYYITTITTDGGQSTVFTVDQSIPWHGGRFDRVRLPGSSVDNITYHHCPNDSGCTIIPPAPNPAYPPIPYTISDLTISATMNGQTWTYGLQNAGSYNLARNSTGPTGDTINLLQTSAGNTNWIHEAEGNFNFDGTASANLSYVVWPGGNTTSFGRDGRGNITQTVNTSAPGFPAATLTETAVYPASCANPVTCNLPESRTDANGNSTVFVYDPVHGGLLRSTGPVVNGIARETRYSYSQRHAWYLNAAGTPIQDPNAIWVLTQESTCRTGAASGAGCATPGDEVVTTYDYGPTTGVNNLLLRGVVHDAAGAAARTCYAYDQYGNKISETAPNANLAACP